MHRAIRVADDGQRSIATNRAVADVLVNGAEEPRLALRAVFVGVTMLTMPASCASSRSLIERMNGVPSRSVPLRARSWSATRFPSPDVIGLGT